MPYSRRMFVRPKLRLSLTLFCCGMSIACQTYDFEPVTPVVVAQSNQVTAGEGLKARPNIMLLVDTSGSMDLPADESLPACRQGNNICGFDKVHLCSDTTACPTRWSELQKAIIAFLNQSGTLARYGLMTFPVPPAPIGPTSELCSAPNHVRVDISQSPDLDVELQGQANQIGNAIAGINSNGVFPDITEGGTPTAASLRVLENYALLKSDGASGNASRSNFIVLLTDGLPNCNPNNPHSYSANPADVAACQCTAASGNCTPIPQLGCLDLDGTLQEILNLKSAKVDTFVVGFGAEASASSSRLSLNALADAGGEGRSCPHFSDAECGPGQTCTTGGKCSSEFYQASNAQDLVDVFKKIILITGDVCFKPLDVVVSDPAFILVRIDSQDVGPGAETWTYTNQVDRVGITFQGSLCQRIQSSSQSHPVQIEIKTVRRL